MEVLGCECSEPKDELLAKSVPKETVSIGSSKLKSSRLRAYGRQSSGCHVLSVAVGARRLHPYLLGRRGWRCQHCSQHRPRLGHVQRARAIENRKHATIFCNPQGAAVTAHPSLHPSVVCSRAPKRIGGEPARCTTGCGEPTEAKIRCVVVRSFRTQGSRLPHLQKSLPRSP